MAAFNDSTQLINIFGFPTYDNFSERVPFTNTPGCLIGFTVTFLALSWLFVLPRLYVRLRVVRMPGLDDLFVFLYLIFTSVASIVFLTSIHYGEGQHFLLLTVGDVRMYLKLFYALNINLNLAAAFIKLSLLFQFLRVFDRGTWPHRASVGGIVFVSLWGITFVILAVFPCTVIPDAWNIFARDAHCWGYGSQDPDLFTATFVSHNLINTLLDIYITAIPFQLYTRPDVTLRTRLGLMVLLLMGATVVTLSAWRVSETIYYKTGWYPTHDPTWYGPLSILLMVLEINVASICASVPIFWPVLRPYLGAIFVTREFSVTTERREASVSSHQRLGSEADLNAHYKDDYIMDLVGPFNSKDGQSRVKIENGGKKAKKERGRPRV
ncbi:hypothetical protein QBC33DRAFT_572436 [Phialemonium atrogriseum]|uniref:Rhodopsin domain-containing protein n=1 Tax=Phialemonium atrogriseum TaxID=1093897 RepID=A0AAJ0BTT8_9PEZI|nr:uncharacterized protein QBC33DRAFT_572436 [Phialemonium atrogriseum]KAK1764360.1 hypothetical protein QBC33DRAFT_572436 [Phialemonium atrogriseum]